MRYFILTDIHAFYDKMIETLHEMGFFSCREEHRLVILGDCLDRGKQPKETVDFLIGLLKAGKLILIRGNHEDLFLDLLEDYFDIRYDLSCGMSHHARNGTFDTALMLSDFSRHDALTRTGAFLYAAKHTPYVKELLPATVDYFETPHYIFTHGFLPCRESNDRYTLCDDWRTQTERAWRRARWINGMKAVCKDQNRVEGKTVVCGHFHTSYGHACIRKNGSEFGIDAIFTPFYADGIIALDACTAHSGKMNGIILDD